MRPAIPIFQLLLLMVGIPAFTTGCSTTQPRELSTQELIRKGNRLSAGIWVPRDPRRAAELYLQAAESGNADALYLVGSCYDSGVGLPKNNIKATSYFARAAYAGNPEAQYRIGLAYSRGTGISKNRLLGYLWLNRAASSGMEKAASSRDALGCRMSPSEVTQAQKLSLEEGQAK